MSERKDLPAEEIALAYPDGVAYNLWPAGVPFRFGLRDRAIYFVRRRSITIVEEDPGSSPERNDQ